MSARNNWLIDKYLIVNQPIYTCNYKSLIPLRQKCTTMLLNVDKFLF